MPDFTAQLNALHQSIATAQLTAANLKVAGCADPYIDTVLQFGAPPAPTATDIVAGPDVNGAVQSKQCNEAHGGPVYVCGGPVVKAWQDGLIELTQAQVDFNMMNSGCDAAGNPGKTYGSSDPASNRAPANLILTPARIIGRRDWFFNGTKDLLTDACIKDNGQNDTLITQAATFEETAVALKALKAELDAAANSGGGPFIPGR